jgi:hypothetical protein
MIKRKNKMLIYVIVALLVLGSLVGILSISMATSKLSTNLMTDYEGVTIIDGDFVVTINGETVNFNDVYGYPKLIKETERTLVPVRIISEQMGYDVDWEQETQTAIVKGGGSIVEVSIGDNTALVNGNEVPIDVQNGVAVDTKAMLINVEGDVHPRTYVPLRFISETTGAKIEYENINGTHHISITTGTVEYEDFDPEEDVDEYGRLTEEKSIEYIKEAFANISVISKNDKYYLKYDHIELPEYGNIVVGIGFSTSTGLALSTEPVFEHNRIPLNQSFELELPEGKIFKGMERVSITVLVMNMNHTNEFNPTSALLMYNYYEPSNSSEYFIFDEYHSKIEEADVDKSDIFGGIL